MPTSVEVPPLGESITEATLGRWKKNDGELVDTDEALCELETDKANVDLPSPSRGRLRQLKQAGDVVKVGEAVAMLEAEGEASAPQPNSPAVPQKQPTAPVAAAAPAPAPVMAPRVETQRLNLPDIPGRRRVPMTKIRKKIAERMLLATQSTAMLTTFNEIDMSTVQRLRAEHKEEFAERHGVGLGLLSFFVRACCLALRDYPVVNAFMDGDDILFHDFVNLGVAVSTDRGLVVPVLKNADKMSLHEIEAEIKRLAAEAREGKLSLDALSGGTFTLTNGGVFGSLMSTPLLNPPQSGIIGLHAIQQRPVNVNGKVEVRPMMYVALSYDHRLVDGKDSVSFLVRVKQLVENPARLLLEL